MQEAIEQLCRQYTDLTEEEIQTIKMMSRSLQILANLENADMFIDCPCKQGRDSIVVAEAKPEEGMSAYRGSVVGMLAKQENEPAVARTTHLGIATRFMKARTQEDNYTIQTVEPIRFNSRVIGVLIREKRITDEEEESVDLQMVRAVETPVSHMLSENEWLMESIDEGLLLIDSEDEVVFRNLYARDLFHKLGYVQDILGQNYKNICLTEWTPKMDITEHIKEVKCGSYFLRIRVIPMVREKIRFAVIIRDITWRHEQEQNLILKSVAVRELHHRIKNNLQTIAALLRMQVRRAEHEETRQVLEDSINRIQSIAATHMLLSQNGEDRVGLRDVLNIVRSNADQTFLRSDLKLNTELLGDDILVDSDIANSVALAANELIQNSMKYAFRDRTEGKITIIIEKGKIYSRLIVKDNGRGYDTGKDKAEGLGLNIVRTLVEDKLKGNLLINSDEHGTTASFDFINQPADFVNRSE